MSSIDIRDYSEEVTEIVFADKCCVDTYYQGYKITKQNFEGWGYFCIEEDGDRIMINTVEHAQNLIKAINKAIELGWVK